jgi:rhodanese-related sulfurtransferase
MDMPLTKEQVLKELKSDHVVILNVLPEAEYQKIHIKGSRNLPLGEDTGAFLDAVEEKFGRGKFFITYCAGISCSAGPNAAKLLHENGFKAEDYPGGIEEWHDNGLPVEGNMVEAPVKA